jgi:pimeloyl-ACP methyl ester carboxylesterase
LNSWAVRAIAATVAALAIAPTAADAASPFRRCLPGAPVDCAIVRVPLDRAGRVPGTVPLHVIRVKAVRPPPPGTPRSAIVGLAGGPGQSALPLIESFFSTMRPALVTRDMIVFDQRGTGRSGLLRCRRLERKPIGDRIGAVQGCATQVGSARAFYTSRDSADDIEAIRQAAEVDRVVPYGTSYGTKVALKYAQRYPDRTERLVLDSVVGLDGPDPFSRDTFGAIPRVLRELCAEDACTGITPDPVGDVAALTARLAAQSLRGFVVGGDGKRRARGLGRTAVYGILLEGDGDPSLRGAFPAAVRSALAGDGAPMLRLAKKAQVNNYFPDRLSVFSPALYTTTTCEEGPLPWDPALSFGDRWQQVFSVAAAIPDTAFTPFDRGLGRANDTLRLCAPWPASGYPSPPDPRPLPDVPTLVLGGAADLRTPAENAALVTSRLPRTAMVTVPSVGHSVLDSDISGCADAAARLFFADKPVPPVCPASSRRLLDLMRGFFSPTPVAPRYLSRLGTPRSVPGRPGRTLRAAELSFFDALLSLIGGAFTGNERVVRIGGLRGGRLLVRVRPDINLRLDRYSYVPGVWISGKLDLLASDKLRLRVGGGRAARGRLTLDLFGDRVTGRLGGRRVRVNLTRDVTEAVGGLYELRRALRARGPTSRLGRCCFTSQLLPPR